MGVVVKQGDERLCIEVAPYTVLASEPAVADLPDDLDSLDENDDGMISIADAIYHFSHLFSGGPTPVAPFDSCGVDMTADDLGCESYGVCP